MSNTAPSRDNLEKAMKLLLDNQELLEASMKPVAQLLFSRMTALVQAGFSRQEALEIIKARGLDS